jgi:succinate-acetate transporter protein
MSSRDERTHHEQVRIMLRPVGSGLPLGFFSFGVGMLLLAGQALEWVPLAQTPQIGMLLMAFVFPLELVAAVFAFLARDTLGATTLGLFTTSWLALGWLSVDSPPGSASVAVGIFLFGFATAVLLLATLSTLGKPLFSVVLLLAATRMVLAGAWNAGAPHELVTISGVVALALSAVAMYGGLALGFEDARHREVLPLFRRGAAGEAFEGYEQQLERLEAEPGVRQQL